MPYYDHNKDYPFAAFITNLGKYNEGELVGEWVKFPTTAEELKEVFKRIGIGQKDDFGQPYEEWFITDYDCYVDGLYSKLGEYENLDELNYLASKLDEMSESEYAQFQAGMEMGDHCGSLQEIINLTENLDCYEVYPDIHDYDDLGRYSFCGRLFWPALPGKIKIIFSVAHLCAPFVLIGWVAGSGKGRSAGTVETSPITTKSACLQNADRRRRIIKSIYMISVFILIAGIVRWRGYAFFNWCRSWTLRKSKKDTAIPPRYRRVLKKGRL